MEIVSHGFTLPKTMQFLKNADTIKGAFSDLQKFIIHVDVADAGVKELSYDVQDQLLRIFVTPKQGFLTKDHVRTAQSDFKYDLIIVLGTQDLESLGELYDNNTELFYRVPILNIDYHPGNEHFGTVNHIDLTATSTAEVIYALLDTLGGAYIDEDIATSLLTGIIAKTKSFKGDQVKPTTLAIASKLMTLGANREMIVHNLYKTKTVSSLKLWGQALVHLQSDPSIGLVWTTITREDFSRSGATEQELYEIVNELIMNAPEARMILLLHEHSIHTNDHPIIHGILHVTKGKNALNIVRLFHPNGTPERASWTLEEHGLKEAETLMVGTIRTYHNSTV